jgi:uncharacterized protein (DUF1015 family)
LKEAFVKKQQNFIELETATVSTTEKHQFGMYLDNEFYSLIKKEKTCFQNSLRKSGHANTMKRYFHHF